MKHVYPLTHELTPWFAWYPVKTQDAGWIWLETVLFHQTFVDLLDHGLTFNWYWKNAPPETI